MNERYRVVGSGEVIELDDPRRFPRLVGNLSWTVPRQDSTTSPLLRRSEPDLPWDTPAWGELVVDCACDDCQIQRRATSN